MKHLFFILAALALNSCAAQNWTAAIPHVTAVSGAPSQSGSRLRFNLTNGRIYEWNPNILDWVILAQGIDPISGCSAPAYTPSYQQSLFALNACTPNPELYHWSGAAWELVGGASGGGTWGTITGTLSDQTDLQTALDAKLESVDLSYIDNGGSDVDITNTAGTGFKIIGANGVVVAEDQPGVIYIDAANSGKTYTAGTGISINGSNVITNTLPSVWTDAGVFTRLTSTSDRVLIGNTTELNTSFRFQSNGGGLFRGSGSTSATYGLRIENSGATGYLYARNDGRLGIGTASPGSTVSVFGAGSTAATTSFSIRNSSSANILTVRNDGQVGIGSNINVTTDSAVAIAAIRAGGDFSSRITYTNNAVTDKYYPVGFLGGEVFYAGSSSYLKARGIDFNVYNDNTATTNDITAGFFSARNSAPSSRSALLTGLDCSAYTDNQNGGTVNDIAGIRIRYIGVNAAGPTATSVSGIKVQELLNSGTITNTYGIYVGTLTSGTQTNQAYSIITTDASARQGLSGKTQLGGTGVPSQTLHVVGNARITGAIYDSNNDPGTNEQIFSSTATGTDWIDKSNILPYKVYSATITQSGTSAPVSVVMQNTLGVTPTWSRSGVGTYVLTATGAFVTAKTTLPNSSTILAGEDSDEYASTHWVRTSADALTLTIIKNTTDAIIEMNNTSEGIFIEIRVYN